MLPVKVLSVRRVLCILGLIVLQPVSDVSACACCADQYEDMSVEHRELMPYEMAEIAQLKLTGSTFQTMRIGKVSTLDSLQLRLTVTSSGWELNNEAWHSQSEVPDTLTSAGTFSWQMTILKDGVAVDSVLFRFDSALQSSIDMRYILSREDYSEVIGDDVETVLYTRVKLFGTLEIMGTYLAGKGLSLFGQAQLLIHGRGNRCMNAEAFDEWSMTFEGNAGNGTHLIVAHGEVTLIE